MALMDVDLDAAPSGPRPVGVLVVTEVCLYREGLAQSLSRHTGVRVVATAADSDGALRSLASEPVDVVLLDLHSVGSAAVVTAAAARRPPAAVVALGVREVEDEVLGCAAAGVAGYVPQHGSVDDLVLAIECAARGELRVTPRMAATLFQRIATLSNAAPVLGGPPAGAADGLTPREREIAALLDSGISNKEIARRLGIGLSTVKNHVHHILEKLRVGRRGAAAACLRERPHGKGETAQL
ncbi:MAG TPA: response regulator transcription factor [Longimicrobiaceae bacterium]|nr:response regulator transcription factor [Longimicrobiaceae bacterium]